MFLCKKAVSSELRDLGRSTRYRRYSMLICDRTEANDISVSYNQMKDPARIATCKKHHPHLANQTAKTTSTYNSGTDVTFSYHHLNMYVYY